MNFYENINKFYLSSNLLFGILLLVFYFKSMPKLLGIIISIILLLISGGGFIERISKYSYEPIYDGDAKATTEYNRGSLRLKRIQVPSYISNFEYYGMPILNGSFAIFAIIMMILFLKKEKFININNNNKNNNKNNKKNNNSYLLNK